MPSTVISLPPRTGPARRQYYVVVQLGPGEGALVDDFDEALRFAERTMQRLAADHERLEDTDFEGIFCVSLTTREVWRFDYVAGLPEWVSEDPPTVPVILPFRRRRRDWQP